MYVTVTEGANVKVSLKFCNWADLSDDKLINPAPGFWPIFDTLGPTAGPGSLGTAAARKIVQVVPKISPGDQV